MKRSLVKIASSFKSYPIRSTAVVLGMIFVAGALLVILAEVLWALNFNAPGFPALFISTIVTIFGFRRLPNLQWFWSGTEIARPSDDTAEPMEPETLQPAEVSQPNTAAVQHANSTQISNPHCKPVRSVPQGTILVSRTADQAVLKVKSAIRFWCWFMPTLFVGLAVLSVPLGAAAGFMIYADTPNNYRLDPTQFMMWGAIIPTGLCLIIAVKAYSSTRPWVLVTITPETIRYGDALFDRDHTNGMQVGYYTDEADLKSSFLMPSFGVQALRLTYGRWGEDLKYMVDKYHASEIVIWMNEIIDGVGAPPPKRYDPYAGQKIELL